MHFQRKYFYCFKESELNMFPPHQRLLVISARPNPNPTQIRNLSVNVTLNA